MAINHRSRVMPSVLLNLSNRVLQFLHWHTWIDIHNILIIAPFPRIKCLLLLLQLKNLLKDTILNWCLNLVSPPTNNQIVFKLENPTQLRWPAVQRDQWQQCPARGHQHQHSGRGHGDFVSRDNIHTTHNVKMQRKTQDKHRSLIWTEAPVKSWTLDVRLNRWSVWRLVDDDNNTQVPDPCSIKPIVSRWHCTSSPSEGGGCRCYNRGTE